MVRQPVTDECKDCHVLAVRVDELEKRIYQHFASDEKLRGKLEQTVDTRLEGMNEFRHQLDRQASTFVTWSALFTVSTTIALLVSALVDGITRMLK